jgi:formylglycine-generating enzyme required for sulfatase activity
MRRSAWLVVFGVPALLVVAFAACVGDDPAPSSIKDSGPDVSTIVDGSVSDAAAVGDGGTDSGRPDTDGSGLVNNLCRPSGDGLTNCGDGGESCCTSPLVTGGTFSRSYDAVGLLDPQYTATVADFRLDKYEITVGRFRKFVDGVVGGWTPRAGSGKHAHVHGGLGLRSNDGGAETGWDVGWNSHLPSSKTSWDSSDYLGCNPATGTWTTAAGANERRPINCINWYQAEAFCIWDGGFLPSEAEWNYAAAGGSEQRLFPWSSPPTDPTLDDTRAVFCGASCGGTQNVGSKSLGNGRYGQTDLAGNVLEWVFDGYKTPYDETSCINCAYLTASPLRGIRGGSFPRDEKTLPAGSRGNNAPENRLQNIGARCARTP